MEVSNDILYVGVDDLDVDLFEGQYPVPNGISYNSYVIMDEKIAVMDTVDQNFGREWLKKVEAALCGRQPDHLVIHHMEPDHSANIAAFLKEYPKAKLVGNAKTFAMIDAFFDIDIEGRKLVVKEGDKLTLGKHELTFVFAPMVHWPEVMMSYESMEKALFTADGFGKFGVPTADEDWKDESRRYYIGIVGKYGAQVQALLKKAAALDIAVICPLHGPVLKEDLGHYISLYDKWSSYTAEEEGVVIAYTSIYGHTKKAVELLEKRLREKGCPNVIVYDLARIDPSYPVADAFRYTKLVLATTTYNADIFPYMKSFIEHLTERNFQKRSVALIENGSWAPMAAKIMKDMFGKSKDIDWIETVVSIKSAVKQKDMDDIERLAEGLCDN